MKKKFFLAAIIATLFCLILCGFTIDPHSSVKTLTKPYITTYECNYARLGEKDLLNKYEYIKITFLDDKKLEVSFKNKKGKRHAYVCPYVYNDEDDTFEAELGILGFKFRQKTVIKDGKFTLSMPILGRPFIMRFAS